MRKEDATAADLRIGGFLPFTAADYPSALAAVVFCQGCPLRCVYCHNPALLPVRSPVRIEWSDVYDRLRRRKGLLDAVVFSGGEPLMQSALHQAMTAVKRLGFRIGLHTSGVAPDRLAAVLHLLDWVGFDAKAPFDQYEKVTGVKEAGRKARRSLAMLAAAQIDTEVRTTVWPGVIDADDVREFYGEIHDIGVRSYVLQEARDPATRAPMGGGIFEDSHLQAQLQQTFAKFSIRRAA